MIPVVRITLYFVSSNSSAFGVNVAVLPLTLIVPSTPETKNVLVLTDDRLRSLEKVTVTMEFRLVPVEESAGLIDVTTVGTLVGPLGGSLEHEPIITAHKATAETPR